MKIRVNDTVLVTTGKDKGKTGKIIKINKKTEKVVVEKVNLKVKHVKKTQSRPGEKISFEAPIHASNVKLICPVSKKPTRVGYVMEEGGKQRLCKKSGEKLDSKSTKKATKK